MNIFANLMKAHKQIADMGYAQTQVVDASTFGNGYRYFHYADKLGNKMIIFAVLENEEIISFEIYKR